MNGRQSVVKLLLDKKVDFNRKNKADQTALMMG